MAHPALLLQVGDARPSYTCERHVISELK